ncbi:MAG: hypothetical protein IJS00_02990 [Paludibacteraceae bacterium]|nr:hypothetical protein [Paludibacteraceae bacterium]
MDKKVVLFLLWGVLLTLVPALCLYNANGANSTFRIVNIAFGILYLLAIVFSDTKSLTSFAWLSFLVIEPVNIIELGWLMANHSLLLQADFWVIYDTNIDEASGFMTTLPISYLCVATLHGIATQEKIL